MVEKILSFLTNHSTVRNIVLGAGMCNVNSKYKDNEQKWIMEEAKNMATIKNISAHSALLIIAKELKLGIFGYYIAITSIWSFGLTFVLWLMTTKSSLVVGSICLIFFIFVIALMRSLPLVYLKNEISKALWHYTNYKGC